MPRGLTGTVEAAAAAEVGARTLAVELLFGSGPMRVVAGASDISIGGSLFTAIGSLGGMSAVQEGRELRSYAVTLTLAGVPRDAVSLALNEAFQNRPGTIWAVQLDAATWTVLADPVVIFKGRIDQMNIQMGETATVKLALRDQLRDWERARVRRYTDQDQQSRFPGDTGLRWVTATVERQLTWPGPSWQPGASGGGGGGAGSGTSGDTAVAAPPDTGVDVDPGSPG